MKHFRSIALTLITFSFLLFQLSGCKKEETPRTYPIEGLWIGTYTYDDQPSVGQQYFSFVIKPDGTMITDTKSSNQQYLAKGTWNLNGTTLTCNYTYVYGPAPGTGTIQSTSATWTNDGKLTGTWINVSPANGSTGTFSLTRVN